MNLWLLRHAKSYRREGWLESDLVRPLTPAGQRQARTWAERLAGEPITRLLSSPARRCTDTLKPLADRTGLPLEIDARLAEGADPELARAWLLGLEGDIVVCSHGDLVPALVAGLPGVGGDVQRVRCRKGAGWQIQGAGAAWTAKYQEEPALGAGEEEAPDAARVGVLDMGSTSFHLLIADVDSEGGITRVGRERVMLRLGATLDEDGRIPPEVRRRAIETAAQLRIDAEDAGARCMLPVATAALREAANGPKLIAELEKALGAPVHVLSGEQEARVVLASLHARQGPGPEPMLALDLGGGSLELALGDEGRPRYQTTLPLGVVRLLAEIGPVPDPLGDACADKLRQRVAEELAPHREALSAPRHARAVAAGGTLRSLVRLLQTESDASARELLGVERLRALADHLVGLPRDRRVALPRMSRRRVDLLAAGAVILSSTCRELGITRLEPCDWGLREGVLLAWTRGEFGPTDARG